jgi:hypothetical protein
MMVMRVMKGRVKKSPGRMSSMSLSENASRNES